MNHLLFQWHMDPFVLVVVPALILFYLFMARTGNGNLMFYCTGILLFIVATSSPLHFLAMKYYFSAHMIVHVLILLICGPLITAGLPKPRVIKKASTIARISKLYYNYSGIAWLCGVLIMWIWHVPAIYNQVHASMHSHFSIFPALQSGSLLIAGIVFSWPIFGPLDRYHIHPLSGIVYLFTACISCSLLGLLITFAPVETYSTAMANMPMSLTSGNPWQMTKVGDQQAAGLIMWVPCCLVYLSGCFILLARWFNEKKTDAHLLSNYLIN